MQIAWAIGTCIAIVVGIVSGVWLEERKAQLSVDCVRAGGVFEYGVCRRKP
jgi:predicted outer membrane lipoprotein